MEKYSKADIERAGKKVKKLMRPLMKDAYLLDKLTRGILAGALLTASCELQDFNRRTTVKPGTPNPMLPAEKKKRSPKKVLKSPRRRASKTGR